MSEHDSAGGVSCLYSVPNPPSPGEVQIGLITGQNFTEFVSGLKATLPGAPVHLTFTNISGVGSNAVLFQDRSHGIVGVMAELDSRDVFIYAGFQAPPTVAQVDAFANQLLQPPA